MPSLRLLVAFLGMVIVVAPPAQGQAVCLTQWGKLGISTIERSPFTADIQITNWQISPEGNRRPVGPLIVFHVARDWSGRVAIKGPLIYGEPGEPYIAGGPKSLETRGEPMSWDMVICDPLTDATVLFYLYGHSVNQPAKKQAQVFSGGSIPGLNRAGTYNRDRMARNGRWMDLGYKELESSQAHGYRWWLEKNPDGTFVEGHFTEQWISDDLASELLVVRMDQTHNREERTELTHIRHIEADPSLFQVPPDYEPIKIDPKPSRP